MFSRKKEKSLVSIPIQQSVIVLRQDTLSLSGKNGCRPVSIVNGLFVPSVDIPFAIIELQYPQGTIIDVKGKLHLYNCFENHKPKQIWWLKPSKMR